MNKEQAQYVANLISISSYLRNFSDNLVVGTQHPLSSVFASQKQSIRQVVNKLEKEIFTVMLKPETMETDTVTPKSETMETDV